MNNQNQMELGLKGANKCPRALQRQSRFNRASWWFNRMREVVDRAVEWQPDPRCRPEQTWFPEDSLHYRR